MKERVGVELKVKFQGWILLNITLRLGIML